MGNQWEAKRFANEQLVSEALITRRYRESHAQVCEINGRRAGIDGREGRAPNALYRVFTEPFIRAATAVSNGYSVASLFHI